MTSKVVDFEMFREVLESCMLNQNKNNNAGANPYDVVMMFKILILQRYYGLGDTQIEYQILDRLINFAEHNTEVYGRQDNLYYINNILTGP
jgi:hypothetical protein